MSIIETLTNHLRGYRLKQLNLNEFIRFNHLSMILNNDLIKYSFNGCFFELYNYEEMLELEEELIEEDLENYFTIEEIQEAQENGELEDLIWDKASETIHDGEVYQYFIIPDGQVDLWGDYTNYPIYYSEEADLYLLGITHYGMSWDYFETDFYLREYF